MLDAVIDVSHHNGLHLDFRAAAEVGIQGVIQKATQGVAGVDPRFAANKTDIQAAGLLFGSYHFGDGSDGGTQANHYLSVANPSHNELLALDLEDNPAGPSMTLEEARAFVTTIFQKIGKWPVLYSGHTLKSMLGGHPDAVLAKCPLWLAQYGPSAILPPGWEAWSLWQYTDGAQPGSQAVNGIGHCDRDRSNGTSTDLRALWTSVSPG
ncbi:MAG TPA: glycoside hydrolase family 25 protein [Rhodopila sp.]